MKVIYPLRMLPAACTPSEVTANTSTDKSNYYVSKLKSLMRFQFDLINPEIHSCYWKSTSESGLTNEYGTRRNRDELVVRRATPYSQGITVL
jgi:hypothetical protein